MLKVGKVSIALSVLQVAFSKSRHQGIGSARFLLEIPLEKGGEWSGWGRGETQTAWQSPQSLSQTSRKHSSKYFSIRVSPMAQNAWILHSLSCSVSPHDWGLRQHVLPWRRSGLLISMLPLSILPSFPQCERCKRRGMYTCRNQNDYKRVEIKEQWPFLASLPAFFLNLFLFH